MTDEEHLATSELEGRQPLDVPEQAPKRTPYVKPILYIKRSGGSVGAWFKENKDSYPIALPMVVCFVYYVVMTFGGVNPFSDTAEAYLEWGGGERESIYVDGEWWRLFTNIFAHAGIEHIMGNLAAYAFGAVFLKEILSPWKVVAVFLACGLAGALVCSVTTDYVFLGASGGVLGLFGAFIGYTLLEASLFTRYKNTLNVSLVVIGISILGSFQAGVSLTAHLVGILSGFLIGCAIPLWKQRHDD